MDHPLTQLATFAAVVRAGSVTGTAGAVGISQPAVSRQIRQLERAYGVRLLQRQGRGIELTAAGETLATYAARLVELAGDAEAALTETLHLKRGSLVLGAGSSIGTYLLPDAIVRFQQRFPGIDLSVETGSTKVLAERLRSGNLEIAICESLLPGPTFTSTVIGTYELVAILPPRHPFSNKRSINITMLTGEQVIARQPAAATSPTLVESVFREAGIAISPSMTLGSTEAVKRAVMAGVGVSVVSEMCARQESRSRDLAVVKLSDMPLRRSIYSIHPSSRKPTKAAVAMVCLIKHVIRGTLPPATGSRGRLATSGNSRPSRR